MLKRKALKALRNNNKGISVIVGTLMIVLITVTAATGFAIFTAEQQKTIQDQEFQITLQETEKIDLLEFSIKYDKTTGYYNHTNLTYQNRHTRDSYIKHVKINNFYTQENQINLTSYAQRECMINDTDIYLFTSDMITKNNSVTIEIITILGNYFTYVFNPPVPKATISYERLYNGTSYTSMMILDATQSHSLNPDTFITSFTWNVTGKPDYHGPVYVIDPTTLQPSDTVTLTIVDNHGMTSRRQYI